MERQTFINEMIAAPFRASSLALSADLVLSLNGDVLSVLDSSVTGAPDASYTTSPVDRAFDVEETLLLQWRLAAPAADLALLFTIGDLPLGAGLQPLVWSAILLALALIGGAIAVYRTGVRQVQLAEQQQDFVSAVSHELKTPITSIRMYGEMLKSGWASEEKKPTYYEHIFTESERLTRLINNVLKLARLEHGDDTAPTLQPVFAGELLQRAKAAVAPAVAEAGFLLEIDETAEAGGVDVAVDEDDFVQIMVNLVDNALKFSRDAEQKTVQLGIGETATGVRFTVRDFGPGVDPQQIKRIFNLFYRAENELTRETVGTGIGLALVKQLADRMQGEVDVINPPTGGAEFRLNLKRWENDQSSSSST